MELLVVTGLSGAGKSLAVNALEDIGYFCIDNIPAGLMPRLLDFALQGETMLEKVAVVVDIRGCRTRSDVQEALTSMDSMTGMDMDHSSGPVGITPILFSCAIA